MNLPFSIEASFSPLRRLSIAASVILSTVCALALAGIANYLAQHYAPRFYWGASVDYRLSALTLGALEALTNEVKITVFFDRERAPYPSVRALLREYTSHSSRLHVEELDYTRNPAAAQEFRRRFPLTVRDGDDPDLVLFESGGRTKVVAARDLRDYDVRALMRGEPEARPVAFKGEMLFTSAINAVCEGRTRRVYFLEGHREHDFRSEAPQTGYHEFATLLEEDNIEVSSLSLTGIEELPADAELVVIAGARDPLSARELQQLDRYLRRGGRLLVLFPYRAQSGLETLLADWGIDAGDSLVLDAENSDRSGVIIVSRFGKHPVTRPLGGSRVYMILPRAVEGKGVSTILGAPARLDPLLLSGTNSVVVTTFVGANYRFRPDDRFGTNGLAVAVERGALPGLAAHLGTTRIIALGDSSMFANQFLQLGANRHLARSSINWLLDRSHLLGGIPPIPIQVYQVSLTPFQSRMLRFLLLGVLPGTALVIGFFVWWRRH